MKMNPKENDLKNEDKPKCKDNINKHKFVQKVAKRNILLISF